MVARLPKWVTTDNFDIEARAPMNNATKDQMRLMVQSLLAERFHLAAHFETQTVPVLMLVLAKPVKVGPNLLPHEKGPPCDSPAANGKGDKEGPFPPACEVYAMIRQQNGMSRLGSRNTTIDLLAGAIQGQVGRPVVDRTGLSGRFDFKLEWAPESNAAAPSGPTPPVDSQLTGPTFLEALDDQLGLKLESAKASVPVLVIDHVERPSEN